MVKNYGESFEKHNEFVHVDNTILLPEAFTDMKIEPGDIIVDFGSRNGTFALRSLGKIAEENGCKIYCVEGSKTMHEFSKSEVKHDKIIHVHTDILEVDPELCFNGDKINKIFSFYVLMIVKDYKAVIQKMYDLLEPNGKACIIMVSQLDDYFKFIQYLRQHPEWNFHGEEFTIHDWIEAKWNGEDHSAVIKNAVGNSGFTIEKFHVLPRSNTFETSEDCAEFLMAGTMAIGGEKNLKTVEQYNSIHQLFVEFLESRKDSKGQEKDDKSYQMDYELTLIVAKK